MITNKGKEIISKFLLGQTPSYASYISIGCGAIPLSENDPPLSASALTAMAAKEKMDFEMTRVPIVSKGFIDDNGVNKLSLTAELPKESRYNITEIGLWSSGSNSLAKNFDSKMIFNFSESWQSHNVNISSLTTPVPLGSGDDITTTLRFFRASNNNTVFSSQSRKNRKEGPRFLDSKILLRGDSSIIKGAAGAWSGDNPTYTVTNKSASGGTATLTLASASATVTNKILTNNVATLTTSTNHPIQVGQSITVSGVDATFNGTYSVTATTSNTISYAKTNANIASASSSGTIVFSENIIGIGDTVTVNIGDVNFDGERIITARTSQDTISFASSASVSSASASGTVIASYSTHIHLNGINFDISQNSPSDKLVLAFSLIDKDGVGAGISPDYVKILIEFYRNEDSLSSGFAKSEIYIPGSSFAGSRYQVVEKAISSLITSPDFSPTQIRVCRIFASVVYTDGGVQKTSPIHYVELEGFRLENISTENPVYGMVGYSVVRTDDGQPIYKYDNTTNYIEFRFNLDVG